MDLSGNTGSEPQTAFGSVVLMLRTSPHNRLRKRPDREVHENSVFDLKIHTRFAQILPPARDRFDRHPAYLHSLRGAACLDDASSGMPD